MKNWAGNSLGCLTLAAIISLFGHSVLAAPLAITSQPVSQSILVNSNVSFTVSTSGGQGAITYQWSFNGTNLVNNGHFSGATTTSLVIVNVTAADAGTYKMTVSDSHGPLVSSNAALTVIASSSPAVVLRGTNSFTLTASGTLLPLAFQWQLNGTNLSNDSRITGANSATLVLTNAQMSDQGNYRVVLNYSFGAVTSAVTRLAIVPIATWGYADGAGVNVPVTLTNAVFISGKESDSYGGLNLGLKSDGTMAAWGDSSFDRLNFPPGLTNLLAVAGGVRHGLALKSDGTVVGWGYYQSGATNVPAGLSNVVDIAAGYDFSLALKNDGTVVGWGQIGVPVEWTNVAAISAGYFHALALRQDGSIVGAGYNEYGQANTPAGLSNVVAVSSGGFHNLALKNDGTVFGWGYGYSGQSTIPAGLSNAVSITAGWYTSMALTSDGQLTGWGDNSANQLMMPSGLGNLVQPVALNYHSMALYQNPAVQVPPTIRWMGSTNRTIPYNQPALLLPVVMESLPMRFQWYCNNLPLAGETNRWLTFASAKPAQSGNYSVVITNNAGSITSSIVTLTVLPPAPPVVTAQTGDQSVIYGSTTIFTNSVSGTQPIIFQWQKNGTNISDGGRWSGTSSATLTILNTQPDDFGNYQLVITSPYGTNTSATAALSVVPMMVWGNSPAAVPLDLTNVISVAAGTGRSIALKSDGTVTVWPLDAAHTPPAGLSNVVAVTMGADPCAALKSDGTIAAWGANLASPGNPTNVVAIEVGNNNVAVLQDDASASGLGVWPTSGVLSMSAGDENILLAKDDGTVVGWGVNYYNAATPPAGLSHVVAVSSGYYHTLVLKSDGTVFAWGDNYFGQTNIPAGLSNVVEIAAGGVHNLALRRDGTVVAWGNYDQYSGAWVPSNLTNVVAISAGGGYSAAIVQNPATPIPPSVWWPGPTNRILTAGRTVMFVPIVNGSRPMNFQWFYNGAPLSGQTNRWLELPFLTEQRSGSYYFTVTNRYGSAVSREMTLSEAPVIFSQPLNQSNLLGGTVAFTAAVVGDATLNCQWYLNGSPLSDDGRVSGSTTTNLTIANLQTNDAGPYQLIVTNQFGMAISTSATLTVLVPAFISNQPTNRTVLTSSNVTFSVTAGGTAPLGYLWHSNGIPLANGGRFTGVTTSNLTITGARTNDSGEYRVIVTNDFISVTSSVASLTVLAPIQIVSHPASQAVMIGSNTSFAVTANGTTPGYQWLFNGAPLSDGGRINGSSSATLTIADVQSGDVGKYSVTVTNLLSAATSRWAALTPKASLAPLVRYVNLNNGTPVLPYLDWSTAATNIQDAVDASVAGELILVTNGIYNTGGRIVFFQLTNRVVIDKPVTVKSVNGPATTVISGSAPGVTGYSARCVYLSNGAMLSGFTLTNGNTIRGSNNPYPEDSGGGVWSASRNEFITNCFITRNFASYGGGAYLGTLVNCILETNSAVNGGGAFSNTLYNCRLKGNFVTLNGAGAYGAVLINCTVVSNSTPASSGGGGGIYNSSASNTIIYYNISGKEPNFSINTPMNYCCAPTLATNGIGNITNAPIFINPAGADFHLQSNSPCINAGNNAYATNAIDLDGLPRIVGGTVDIGAYEYQSPASTLSYAWAQQYGLPTDGSADNTDLDGDGMNNFGEFKSGTIPTNALSVLKLNSPVPGIAGFVVIWQSVGGVTYYVQRSTNLSDGFITIVSNRLGSAGTTSYADTTATNTVPYFYRVGVQ